MPDPTPRRRLSLDDLRNDLAQVAPAQTDEDLDAFAGELRRLLAGPEGGPSTDRVINKHALWERVSAEIDRLNAEAPLEDGTKTGSDDGDDRENNEPDLPNSAGAAQDHENGDER